VRLGNRSTANHAVAPTHAYFPHPTAFSGSFKLVAGAERLGEYLRLKAAGG